MDFRFDEDEREILAQAGLTLRKCLPVSRLGEGRDAVDGWRAIGEAGWLQAGLDSRVGGGDLPQVMVAAIGREAGRTLAGDGYVNNAVVLPALFAGSEAATRCSDLLERPGFVVGLEPHDRAYGVEPGLSAYRVVGTSVQRFAPGSWDFEPLGGLGVTTGTVRFRGVEPELTIPLEPDPGAAGGRERIVHAATLIGLGEAALELTVEHAKVREQFGGPIGRFQAVKHALADVTVSLEVAWNAVLYAALKPADGTVPIAHLQATRAADLAVRTMIQLFGGIAMTWEHDAHWYVKVAETSRARFGSVTEHALLIADLFTAGTDE